MYFFFILCVLWCGSVTCATVNSGSNSSAIYHIQLPLPDFKGSVVKPAERDDVNNGKTYYFRNIPLNNNTTLGVRYFQFKNQTNSTKPLTIKRIVVTNSVTLKPVQTVIARTIRMSRRNKPSGEGGRGKRVV